MKYTALFALALLAAAPVHANDFLGMNDADVQAMIGLAKADQHLQRLKDLGQAPSSLSGNRAGWSIQP